MREREPGAVWGGWWLWEPPAGKTKELRCAVNDEGVAMVQWSKIQDFDNWEVDPSCGVHGLSKP